MHRGVLRAPISSVFRVAWVSVHSGSNLTRRFKVMIPKHGVTLEVWSAIYGTSVSFLKRASAGGVDISNRKEGFRSVREHGRASPRFAFNEGSATSQVKLDPKERARARTRENPAVHGAQSGR